jgi:hypothetical protein
MPKMENTEGNGRLLLSGYPTDLKQKGKALKCRGIMENGLFLLYLK